MKNTITLLVAVLSIACVLPSCGTTLVKRQHGSGYYVNKNPRVPNAVSERNDNKHIKPRTTNAENATPETNPSADEQATLVRTSNETEIQLATNDQSNGASEETALKTDQSTKVDNDKAKPSLYEWASNTRLSPKMNFASADQQSGSARTSEDGLSLFGIVILILLILWLVAAISGGWGLGGLIHILLIVALILLILWLLRII